MKTILPILALAALIGCTPPDPEQERLNKWLKDSEPYRNKTAELETLSTQVRRYEIIQPVAGEVAFVIFDTATGKVYLQSKDTNSVNRWKLWIDAPEQLPIKPVSFFKP